MLPLTKRNSNPTWSERVSVKLQVSFLDAVTRYPRRPLCRLEALLEILLITKLWEWRKRVSTVSYRMLRTMVIYTTCTNLLSLMLVWVAIWRLSRSASKEKMLFVEEMQNVLRPWQSFCIATAKSEHLATDASSGLNINIIMLFAIWSSWLLLFQTRGPDFNVQLSNLPGGQFFSKCFHQNLENSQPQLEYQTKYHRKNPCPKLHILKFSKIIRKI